MVDFDGKCICKCTGENGSYGCESPGPGFLENNPNPNNLLNWWLVNRVS